MTLNLSRRSLLVGAAGGIGLGLAGNAFAQQAPRLNISKTAARPDKPNIILIVLDTVRRDHIGAYGNKWIHTPSLDYLASQSLRFTHAVPEAMPTIPARRSIHSGMRTFPFRNWDKRAGNDSMVWGWQHIPDDQPTTAEQLLDAGYETILVSDVPHEFKASMNFTRGFKAVQWIRGQEGDDYMPYWISPEDDLKHYMYRDGAGEELNTKGSKRLLGDELRQYLANTKDRKGEDEHFAARVFRTAGRMIEQVPRDKPFFMTVDSFDPHEPWDAPRAYADRYDDPDYNDPEPVTPAYGSSDYLTERQLQRMRALYAGELTMVDRWLGIFLEKVEDMGLFDNTLIILTSDHGMALGEHGAVGKPSYALWPEMTDTPIMIRHPNGTAAGGQSDYFASTHDLAPTILAFAGLQQKKKMEGNSLLPTLDGKTPDDPRKYFTSGLSEYVWVSDRKHTMIARNDGSEAKLYDVVADPQQTNDIASSSEATVRSMFDLVLRDAGDEPLPQY